MTKTINDPLSAEEIGRYLQAKHAVLPCPRCGFGGWTYIEEVNTGDVAALSIHHVENGSVSATAQTLPLILSICQRCAFVAPHAKARIVAFLNEEEDKG